MTYYALLLLSSVLLLASPAFADAQLEPAQPIVQPVALICVEAPGTSALRPCLPWCAENAATDVLRLMQSTVEGVRVYQWQGVTCAEYIAEQTEA